MAKRKRQTNRKVLIRFVGRNPEDPVELLEAIEDVFRPKDIEVQVETVESSNLVADEQLETLLRKKIADALDENEEKHQPEETSTVTNTENEPKARAAISKWIAEKARAGWRVIATVAPVLEKLKKIFEF